MISIRWSKKKHKTIEKVEMLKILTVNPLFIHTKFVTKKWVNRRHFFIDEKNLQICGLTAQVLSV